MPTLSESTACNPLVVICPTSVRFEAFAFPLVSRRAICSAPIAGALRTDGTDFDFVEWNGETGGYSDFPFP